MPFGFQHTAFAAAAPLPWNLHLNDITRPRSSGVCATKWPSRRVDRIRMMPLMISTTSASPSPVLSLPSVAALNALVRGDGGGGQNCGVTDESPGLVVVKLFAGYCRACLGVAPRFKKSARCFLEEVGGDRVAFAEMDYQENEDFCRDELGVESLPFFAIFRKGDGGKAELVEGHVLPWNKLSVLDKRVSELLQAESEMDASTEALEPTT